MSQDMFRVESTDIAIVGMAAQLPGAATVAEFWDNLCRGVESIRPLTEEELIAAGESRSRMRDANYVAAAAPLDGFDGFDADFFGLSPKEAAIMDPQHRKFLETCWHALEDSAHTPEGFDGLIGVYAGCGMGSYFYWNLCSNRDLVDEVGHFLLRHTGNDKDFLSTRVSHIFDLRGPSVNVQTACSTSLVAIHTASQALLAGDCDMALAGGVTIELPQGRGYLYKENEILSPDGHCHAFDHRAQGTVFGSGAAVIVLRRLADAIADGDHIWAVIKGGAINNDGAAKAGYLAPSVEGQAQAISEALVMSGVEADSVGYIECHGTGTALGDPIEVAALNQAFEQMGGGQRQDPCYIGSVKTNIGHLDTAAGSASLIKSALAVHHGKIPPTLGYEQPNPAIDFDGGPFKVCDRLHEWSAPLRRAGVNSLGVGGTNAHLVLQQPPKPAASAASDWPFHILTVSGRTKAALDANSAALSAWLLDNPDVDMADLSWTLTQGRRRFDRRRVLVAETAAEAARLLAKPDPQLVFDVQPVDADAGVVFMLPGGGAQYAGMAHDLYATEPVFREWMDRGLDHMAGLGQRDLRALWLPTSSERDAADQQLLTPSLQLPLLMITEYALAQLWISWGVQPTALIGHSMGENTAACLAGVMSFEDCIGLVHLRGQLFDTVPAGGMLSVELPPEGFAKELSELGLDLAAINAPALSVVSGPDAKLDEFAQKLAARGVETQRIAISIAAHSRMLEPILGRFRDYLASIALHAPQIPIISNQSGVVLTDAQAQDPDYWVQHLRGTVNFAGGIDHLARQGDHVFIEVGPGRAMRAMAQSHPDIVSHQIVSTLRHRDQQVGDDVYFMTSLARVWAAGQPIDWDQIWAGQPRRRLPLPGYQFQRKRYFIERALPEAMIEGAEDLIRLEDPSQWGWRPAWQQAALRLELGADGRPVTLDQRHYLVFLDDAGLGQRLVAQLREQGQHVATVQAGDRFADLGEGSFILPPESDREGYEMLLAALIAQDRTPERILHLWSVTVQDRIRPGSSLLNSRLENGIFSLLHLSQAIGSELPDAQLDLIAITNEAFCVGNEGALHPEKATAIGPIRVLPHEAAGVSARLVDIRMPALRRAALGRVSVDGAALDVLAGQLLQEAMAGPLDNHLAAWRGAARFEQDLQPVALPESDIPAIEPGQVCLITGGFGGIGQTIAHALAARGGARLALITRSPITESRIARAVAELEALGAEVLPLQAEVTSPEDMRRAMVRLHEYFGTVDVVLHAAGITRDDLIAAKNDDDVWDVLAPKLLGTQALLQALQDHPAKLTVLFSSTSSVIGAAGQVDYVAANEYLNAVAKSAPPAFGRTVAVNWGLWADAGMAARAAGLDQAGPEIAGTPVGRPLLDESQPLPGGRQFRKLLRAQDWIIGGHRTAAGQALMPGTGWVEMIAEAAAESGMALPVTIRDLEFMRPALVPDGGSSLVTVRVEPEGGHLRISVLEDPAGAPNVSALVESAQIDAPQPRAVPDDWQQDGQGHALRSAQDGQMRFGQRWQVLRRYRLDAGQGSAELMLDPAFAGDLQQGYLMHPALLDIATGWAMELVEGWRSDHLWVPMGYEQITVHRPMGGHVISHIRNAGANTAAAGMAQFDIILTQPDGQVTVEIKGFAIRRLESGFNAAPVAVDRPLSPAERRLHHNISQGIPATVGPNMLDRAVASGLAQVFVSSLDLPALIHEAALPPDSGPAEGAFERPDLDGEFIAPLPGLQSELAQIWSGLLGIAQIGAEDSFFDLGGHSLIAVRMFGQLRKAVGIDLPISTLFEAPTIARLAALIEEKTGPRDDTVATLPDASTDGGAKARPQRRFVVDMGGRDGGTPYFMVAGMFGNVMNLRQLAQRLGVDRRFYGLQARGLFGDDVPHQDFAEAARDYLEEVIQIQPHGPYLLGGFSGGGLIALEMARILKERGEEVAQLVMLDTPLPMRPGLSRQDKLLIRLTEMREQGPRFAANWISNKLGYEMARRQRDRAPEPTGDGAVFHDRAIETAFRAALPHVRLARWEGPVAMFRPPLDRRFKVSGGQWVTRDREYLLADNGWTPWMPQLRVLEVPGDHDSMVLEPNVRRLASVLRQILEDADNGATSFRQAAE